MIISLRAYCKRFEELLEVFVGVFVVGWEAKHLGQHCGRLSTGASMHHGQRQKTAEWRDGCVLLRAT